MGEEVIYLDSMGFIASQCKLKDGNYHLYFIDANRDRNLKIIISKSLFLQIRALLSKIKLRSM